MFDVAYRKERAAVNPMAVEMSACDYNESATEVVVAQTVSGLAG